MVNVPFRELASKGVLRDPASYQIDLSAWSRANNVRFHGNAAESSPIFRTVADALADPPRFCVAYTPPNGTTAVYYAGSTGKTYEWTSGTSLDLTYSGWSATSDPRAWTGMVLADVLYFNTPSAQPTCLIPTATQFTTLPGWDASWSCRALRGFQSYAVALNVTKGSSTFPNMVKWSDLTLAGQAPGSWNQNDATTSAGENILEALDTPLLDGVALHNSMVLYTSNQVWAMTPSGDFQIFTFVRLFGEGGLLAPNCATDVDGKHYVFGPDDIYVHDGITKLSLVDKKNKDAIYRNLNRAAQEAAFTVHFPTTGEVLFAYPSADPDALFPSTGIGCNRGYVYALGTDTGSFVDLPNVTAATLAPAVNVLTYATAGAALTYASVGGSYWDQEGGTHAAPIFASQALTGHLTNSRLLAYDFYARGFVAFPFCAEASSAFLLERTGIDLDQLGSDIGTAKIFRRLFPQVVLYGLEVPISIYVGSGMTPSGPINWNGPITFDPVTQYKIDCMRGGRYLAVRFVAAPTVDFALVGYDADVTPGGSR